MLGFRGEDSSLWLSYITSLRRSHIHISHKPDSLIWNQNEKGGFYSPSLGYTVIREEEDHLDPPDWNDILWKLNFLMKIRLLF